jgi:ketosteroid isomerase-like protein
MSRNPVEAVLAFLDAINAHDVDALLNLMTEDHAFIDSLGKRIEGREKMRAAWNGYFAFCPDYRVSHEDIVSDGNLVLATGTAGGTIAATHWEIPSAWKALIKGGLLHEWRVYADNKPVYDILAKQAK